MSDLVAIGSDELVARINPFGAELWSLTDRAGREYMTDADPAYWTGRAPLLFPIVGALNSGRYRVVGSEHALAKHGFARTSTFEVAEPWPLVLVAPVTLFAARLWFSAWIECAAVWLDGRVVDGRWSGEPS